MCTILPNPQKHIAFQLYLYETKRYVGIISTSLNYQIAVAAILASVVPKASTARVVSTKALPAAVFGGLVPAQAVLSNMPPALDHTLHERRIVVTLFIKYSGNIVARIGCVRIGRMLFTMYFHIF